MLIPLVTPSHIIGPRNPPYVCSRQLAVPATRREESGAESRFPHLHNESEGLGSPGGRIPEAQHGCQGKADAHMGNLDVRVPEVIRSEEGLPRRGIPIKEDAGGREEEDEIRNEEENELTTTASPKTCGAKATMTKEEGTEGRESHHVPGGMWLHQLAVPATRREESGAGSRFPHLHNESEGLGSPGGWIPEAQHGCQGNADAHTGNPDVRVPEVIRSEEGLPRRGIPIKEDAGGREEEDEIRNEEENELTTTASPKTCGAKATTTMEEGTEV
ncbi:hypothetical protein NDU88_002430 [Pleurodeles waltl]|uniref:Uncharacterized protein n=1 Tax=Pleurodeles waltl TaxID=8319 RepID=A0AAV7T2C0_PLEWA|nr:hypothetical protein NDU88_002430 [Pleurodeles waltl]